MIVENVHNIIAAGAVNFNEKQASQLFGLITKSWVKEDNKGRQRLLNLLGKLGMFQVSLFLNPHSYFLFCRKVTVRVGASLGPDTLTGCGC